MNDNLNFWSYVAGSFSLGLGVWLFSWGFNRVYLFFKSFIN